MRGRRPSRTVSDPTAVRLKTGHTLTVTETALVFLENARRRGKPCHPMGWIPEVHHSIGSGEAVIPDALLYYQRGPADGDNGSMLAAKLSAYERLYRYVPAVPGRRPTLHEPALEEWRRTRRSREPEQRPVRGGRAAGAVPLPSRRPRPRGAAGRPAPPRPLRTRVSSRPRARPASPLDWARASTDMTRGRRREASAAR